MTGNALVLRLFALQLKLSWRNFTGRITRDRGGWRSFILIGLILLGFLPALISLTAGGFAAYVGAKAAGHPELALTIVMAAGQLVALVFGFFYVMSAFYFARDLKVLLPLPLRPSTIIAAKFMGVLLSEYLTMAVVVLPAFFAYGVGSGGLLFWPVMLIVFLLLPVLPLAVDGLLVLIVMTATSSRKIRFSRDVLRVLGALVGVGMVIFSQYTARSRFQSDLPKVSLDGGVRQGQRYGRPADPFGGIFTTNSETLQSVSRYLPHTAWATQGLANPLTGRGAAGLLAYIALSLGVLALLLASVNRVYLRGALADEGGGPRATATVGEVRAGLGRVRTPFAALLWREYALLVRTPMFVLNGILPLILVPVASLGPLLATGGLSKLREALQAEPVLVAFLPAIGVGVSIFIAVTGAVTATAISREGRRFWISRVLPVDPGLQAAAKIGLGVLHSLLGVLMVAAVMLIWLRAPLSAILLMLIGALAVSSLVQGALLLIDLVRPYLQWTDPQQAMKGNLNVVFGLLMVLLILALLAGIAFLLFLVSPRLIMPGLILVSALGAYGFYQWDIRLARVRYREIED